MHGERSKTPAYRLAYAVSAPLWPVLRWAFPAAVVTTEQIGRAIEPIDLNEDRARFFRPAPPHGVGRYRHL